MLDPAPLTQLLSLPTLQNLAARLAGSGVELYLVGGAVRDALLGHAGKDIDLLIRHPSLDAAELETLLRKRLAPAPVLGVGESFRVLKVKWEGEWLDLALPTRRLPADGRATVEANGAAPNTDAGWSSDPRWPLTEDLGRRDFTINALALCLLSETSSFSSGQPPILIDPFGGQQDLTARQLRATLSAVDRLNEDPLRILRAARFTAQGFAPDKELSAAAQVLTPRLEELAPERLWHEWLRIFEAPHSSLGLRWLAEVGALGKVIPAWTEVDRLEQHNPHHSETVSDHLLSVVAELDRMNAAPLTRQAGFFHDIGKGRTRTLVQQGGQLHGHFYGHEHVGADLTRQSLSRLRADHHNIRDLSRLVELHMRPGQAGSRAAARRLAAAAGELLEPLLDLFAADRLAHLGEDPAQVAARQQHIRWACEDLPRTFSEHDLALGGRTLLSLGLSPHEVGAAKRWLFAQVLEGRAANDSDELMTLLQAEYLP